MIVNGNNMNLLFWNLKENSNGKWIELLLEEKEIDIAVFCEYSKTDFSKVTEKTQGKYLQFDGYGGCKRITLVCTSEYDITISREQHFYTLYTVRRELDVFNLVGVHLPSNLYGDEDDRKYVIRDLIQDIKELESNNKSSDTIVIGDFNCNPFDEEIIQKDMFNAVLFQGLIEEQEKIKYNGKYFQRFYNPVLHFLSENTKMYGSYYYTSGIKQIYWNSFDQILVRKSLAKSIANLDYIKSIDGHTLLSKVKPKESISDHLPLFVVVRQE